MNWTELLYSLGYVAVAFVTIYISGWLIYDKIATRGYSLSEAIFKQRNLAAGLEISAFLFVQVLIAVNALSGASVTKMLDSGAMVVDYSRDLEASAVTILFSNLTFFVFRWIASSVIRRLYKGKIDNQGDAVDFNNEIFKQQNMGAAFFSISYLLIMYFMIFQEDFLGMAGYLRESYFNMGAVFITGLIVYWLHKVLFLQSGHTTLDELFLDNNSGVGMSLCGFMFAVLYLQREILESFGSGEHFFKTSEDTYFWFVISLVCVVVLRFVFTKILGWSTGTGFQKQFVEDDNPVMGLLDMTYLISSTLLLGAVLLN
jgi:hypothetical protein